MSLLNELRNTTPTAQPHPPTSSGIETRAGNPSPARNRTPDFRGPVDPIRASKPDRKTKPKRYRRAQFSEVTDLVSHRRRCKVCKHPQCDFIELDFVDWRSPAAIAKRYGIRDRASIYRHAHAIGLYSLRRQNLAMALDNLIERADEVKVTSSAIVRAIRARTRITDDGCWVDPPNRSIVTHLNASPDSPGNPYSSVNRAGSPDTFPPGPDRDYYWKQYTTATQNHFENEPNH